jgi:2-desacetyl-2-hydroxyethyl bacteriochlorophyllide A dehydrogenase
MKTRYVQFKSPYNISVVNDDIQWPQSGKLLIKTLVSAISSGTELLVYRGQWPQNCVVDETIASLSEDFSYPLKYGYSSVGRVVATGSDVDPSWMNKRVFCFNPHESLFIAAPHETIVLPDEIDTEDAALLPNMETAVNLVMDGHPVIGERVCVFGLGVVGLLATAVLAHTGLEHIATFDRIQIRRDASLKMGADSATDPVIDPECSTSSLNGGLALFRSWADLSFELSGNPAALDSAIESTGFGGRVIIGSWYGSKKADLNLGGYFHRSRIKLVSSQVSSIAPEFTDRWTKARRMDLATNLLRKIRPSQLITHRFSIDDASQAYELIDQKPEKVIQAIFKYED